MAGERPVGPDFGRDVGVNGSVDAASVPRTVGGMVTIGYKLPDFPAVGTTLTMGNMVGYAQTLSFRFRGYGYDRALRTQRNVRTWRPAHPKQK